MAYYAGKGQMVLDNTTDGFDLYQSDTMTKVRRFASGTLTKKYPRQVALAESGRVVVGGSDCGVIYLFDRRTGAPLDVLRHTERSLIQAITVRREREAANQR